MLTHINNWYSTFIQIMERKEWYSYTGITRTWQCNTFKRLADLLHSFYLSEWYKDDFLKRPFLLLNLNMQLKCLPRFFLSSFGSGHAYPCLSVQICSKSRQQLGISASLLHHFSNLSRQVFFWCKRFQSSSLFLKTQLTN